MFPGKPKQRLREYELAFTRYCCVWVKCITMVFNIKFVLYPHGLT